MKNTVKTYMLSNGEEECGRISLCVLHSKSFASDFSHLGRIFDFCELDGGACVCCEIEASANSTIDSASWDEITDHAWRVGAFEFDSSNRDWPDGAFEVYDRRILEHIKHTEEIA